MAPSYALPLSPTHQFTPQYTYSNGHSSAVNMLPTITTPQSNPRVPPRRSMKQSMLPDIAETSPISPPVVRPTRTVRPQSLQSLLSVGTIEVDGFGFLEEEDAEGGDDIWDMESLSPSMYEGSIYDGENEDGRVTPSTLSRRAERVLENAKKKLDLCGQNLTMARHSLIVSPPGSSLSRHSDPDSGSRTTTPTLPPIPPSVAQLRNNATHARTLSESAVPTAYNLARASSVRSNGSDSSVRSDPSRSKSAQQMRVLRDQMKDLRGKISNLQRSDSVKRTSSIGLTSSPVPSQNHMPSSGSGTPTWEDEDLHRMYPEMYAESVSSSRTATPKPVPVRESRHEDREDAFSYDSLFIGNGIYAPRTLLKQAGIRSRSSSAASRRSDAHSDTTEVGYQAAQSSPTLGAPRDPSPTTLRRLDSFNSISSYATADDGGSGYRSSSSSSSSSLRCQSVPTSSPKVRCSPTGEDRVPDDGYHSAPHTPRGSDTQKDPTSRTAIASAAAVTSPRPPSGSFLLPPTPGDLSRRGSRIMSGSAGVEISSDVSGTDISLQLGLEDRLLIERLIEELGKTCCAMEVAKDQDEVAKCRRKLEMALRVLEG